MTATDISPGPPANVPILDLGRIPAAPTATQLRGDFGADVIGIGKPDAGDDTHGWGPPFPRDRGGNQTRESAYYLCANRNKRSVALDISTPEGRETIRKLLASRDIPRKNFKVGGRRRQYGRRAGKPWRYRAGS